MTMEKEMVKGPKPKDNREVKKPEIKKIPLKELPNIRFY